MNRLVTGVKEKNKAQLLGKLRRHVAAQYAVESRRKGGIADDTTENGHGVKADLHDGEEGAGVFLHF